MLVRVYFIITVFKDLDFLLINYSKESLQFIPPLIIGLSKAYYKEMFNICVDLIKSDIDDLVRVGLISLSNLDFSKSNMRIVEYKHF